MHPSKSRSSVFGAALLVGFAAFGAARGAAASPTFPPLLQKALEAQFPGQAFCVPQCTACHKTNIGGAGTTNAFGMNLLLYGRLTPGAKDVTTPLATYFTAVDAARGTGKMPNGDTDGDGVSDADELKALSSPAIAGSRGEGQLCPDIRYGCGARVASPPPPVDRIGLLSAGLALFGFAFIRRRFRAERPR